MSGGKVVREQNFIPADTGTLRETMDYACCALPIHPIHLASLMFLGSPHTTFCFLSFHLQICCISIRNA